MREVSSGYRLQMPSLISGRFWFLFPVLYAACGAKRETADGARPVKVRHGHSGATRRQ